MEERKNKVAWSGMFKTRGNADTETQQRLKDLLDDFCVALEKECKISEMDRFLFPIYRKFEVAGIVTDNNIFYIISPNAGDIPLYFWSDIRREPDQLTGDRILDWAARQLGWMHVWEITLDSDLLNLPYDDRKDRLLEIARIEVKEMKEEVDREARIVKCDPIFEGREFYIQKDLCFVLMPFDPPFIRLYEEHIKPTLERTGFRVKIANDFSRSIPIINDIWKSINEASLIVADLTGNKPNVFYELGIAHTIGKKSIILTQNENDVPFDIKHVRYFAYTDDKHGWEELEKNLKKAVLETIS